jgi:AraC family transcriptional regulator
MSETRDLQPPTHGFALPVGSGPCRRPVISAPGCFIYFDRQQPATWAEHRHQQLQITFVFAGAECVAAWRMPDGTRQRYLIPGAIDQVLLMPAGRGHAIEWHKEAEVLSLYVDLEWSRRLMLRDVKQISVEPLKFFVETSPIIGEIVALFRREFARPDGQANEVTLETLGPALAAQLLLAQFARFKRKKPSRRILPTPRVNQVCSHIANNLEKELSLATLARIGGLSPSYFGQAFRAATGLSPHAYVTQTRILRAKELLATGDHSVAEVSLKAGFGEPHRMNYHFRQLLKTPPSAYLPLVSSEKMRR